MAAAGTRDGRDVLRTFDKLYADGSLDAAQGRPLRAQRQARVRSGERSPHT